VIDKSRLQQLSCQNGTRIGTIGGHDDNGRSRVCEIASELDAFADQSTSLAISQKLVAFLTPDP
jgi:hypothetical protein